jgi:hypothetical protein
MATDLAGGLGYLLLQANMMPTDAATKLARLSYMFALTRLRRSAPAGFLRVTPIGRCARAEEPGLRFGQFAFPRNPLMLFIRTFDAVFILATIVRELFNHFIDAAWHIATDGRLEHHGVTNMEFMRRHR